MLAKQKLYISSNCNITGGKVFKNTDTQFADALPLAAFLLSVYQHFKFSYPKFYKMDNLSKLGWLAAEVLLQNVDKSRYQPEKVGLVLANRNSSLDNDLKFAQTLNDIPSPSVFVYTLPNIVIGEICIKHKFKGEHSFYIQDKFDADMIHEQVSYLMEQNILQACICGWVDVLGDDYNASLFLIEKQNTGNGVLFSPDGMNAIFNTNE
jgi:hypothetical protein